MRLVKMFGLTVLAAVAAATFVGPTPASALPTQYCEVHVDLECPEGEAYISGHVTLATGSVWKFLSSLVTILCLGVLVEGTALELGQPQAIHGLSMSFTGCGTGSAHTNCTVTTEEQPLAELLKTGLDTGSLTVASGRLRLVCSNIGLDCKYDLEGILFSVGSQHLTASQAPVTELGGKFFCPDEGKLDTLLKTLSNAYVLQ